MNKQRGMSIFNVVALLVLLVIGFVAGVKLIPAYLEYFAVAKVMTAMAKSEDLDNMQPPEIQKAFDRRATIDNITAVEGKDLTISDEGGKVVASADWEKRIPLIANVSACIDFHASTAKR